MLTLKAWNAFFFPGGLQAIVELLQLDEEVNGNTVEQYNITMRRYACMALTNLTFGDGTNKALLCSYKGATRALVSQLRSPNEDLCQVAASVLRNLSWRADLASKKVLREVGSVVALMEAAMAVEKESTLKSILSALWNLSAHCSENKEDICAVNGALKFLVGTLTYQSPSKTLAVVENGGGILRNISSHIAVCEDYRTVLRQHDCLQILLHHLESSSLTIVSNACGTLWNLSARCAEDQQMLWDLGAINKLRNLIHSKHKMISMGSAAALKNLLSARPEMNGASNDRMLGAVSPGLHVRRQRALEAELEAQELTETCENIEGFQSRPTRSRSQDSHVAAKLSRVPIGGDAQHTVSSFNQSSYESSARPETRSNVGRSESQDSVGSTHSDISHDRTRMPSQLIKKPHTLQSPLEGPERRMSDENRLGLEALASSQKLGRLMQMMHEAKVHSGLQPGDYVRDGYLGKGPHSLESSPASHRRWQEGAGRYSNIGKRVAYLSSADEAMSFTHLSPCMENLHLTMPELDQDQDEPINFSTKYVEVPQDPTNDPPLPQLSKPSKHPARVADVQLTSTQSVHGQRKMAPIQDVGGGVSLPNPQVFASVVLPGRPAPQVAAGRSATSVRPVRSATTIVTGHSAPPVAPGLTAPIRPLSSIRPPLVPNSVASVGAVGFVGKAMFTQNGHPHVQGRVMASFSGYGKAELDVEQPTNYSIQFAECDDEDEERSFAEEPINYSTRYTEHETTSHISYSLPETHCATSGFNDDTVTTFCTEGTPMNFLSTATSMNDLSCRGATAAQRRVEASVVPKVGSKETVERNKSHSDAECSSISGSQSTDHHTASTVVTEKQPEEMKSGRVSTADNVFPEQSTRGGQVPSMYSYKDSTGASSPCDKPKQYCTEGTPMCFSHSSSLSSLQIPEVSEEDSPGKLVLVPKPGLCLPDIDENSALDVMNSDETTAMTSKMTAEGGAAAASSASGHHATTKTVTFDDNNQIQIQETPLMFSRCSSLGSLSSFDTHSVHSSVVSEYSRRASEVVSPSDLPDSPCDTMPPSPSYKSNAMKFSTDPREVEKTDAQSQPKKTGDDTSGKITSCTTKDNNQTVLQLPSVLQASGIKVLTSGQNCEFSEQSSPVVYADEGSVCGISGGTSLSALTLDDDAEIPRKLSRRIKPLGEEERHEKRAMPSTNNNARELIKTAELSVEDDDNSSVSEGEENMLAECISLAMPSKSSKHMVHSCSDGLIKQKETGARRDACTNRGISCSKIMTSPSLGVMPAAKAAAFGEQQRNMYHTVPDVVDAPGCDSPRKYATEDTPLNFSHCGSLGDLSADSSNLANTTVRFVEKPETKPTVDDNSDVSSLSDSNENYEDLLFEVIEAAMPKSKKPWKPSSSKNAVLRSEGSGTKTTPPKVASRNPVVQVLKPGAQGVRSMNGYSYMLSTTSELDGVKTYAVEGTPIEFSRSTSLSNLTIESMDGADKDRGHVLSTKSQGCESRPHPPGEQQSITIRNPTFHAQNLASEDVMHSYGIEDTPAVFSRNDSLSSLSGAEDEEAMRGGSNRGAVGMSGIKPPENRMVLKTQAVGRTSLQSPTVARLRTPCAGLRIFSSGTNLTSTPVNKQMRSPTGGQEDQVVQYAVEGTPENVSRNLSPTPRFTVTDNRNLTEPEPDQSACFRVEGTPAQFSCNSSLSSLSLESFSFEPTPSEAALLEECINAAMPKSKKRSKKSELPHTSPLRGSKPSVRRSLGRETSCDDVKGERIPQMKTPSLVEPRADGKHERTEKRFKDKNDVQAKHPDVAGFAGIVQISGNSHSHTDNRRLAATQPHAPATKEIPNPPGVSGHRLAGSSTSTSTLSATDVVKESFPEYSSSALLDLTPEDDALLSGPSTGANNTVIYRGPQINDIPEAVNAEKVVRKEDGLKEQQQLSTELEMTTDFVPSRLQSSLVAFE